MGPLTKGDWLTAEVTPDELFATMPVFECSKYAHGYVC